MRPNVFVSSTCFDLSQVRKDIEETIEKIGFNPILSDRGTFPVNPNEELISNCVNNVSKNADLLILIIGNRYGSKSETGKSITNIEYDTARQIGIPIFVFIKTEILNFLEVWKSNKDGDFANQVDTKEIFEFVSKIREKDKVWSFDFTNAQDISRTFISQIAFRFKELLDLNKSLETEKVLSFWDKISSKAKKILLKQNTLYELDFFRQVLLDELNKLEDIKTHYEYNMLSTCSVRLENFDELNKWFNTQLKSLHNFVNTFDVLINKLLKKYYGEPGIQSDKRGLHLVSQSYGKLMSEMLLWSLNVKSVSVPVEAEELLDVFSKYLDDPIKTCWDFPNLLEKNINVSLEKLNKGESEIHLKIILELKIDEKISNKFDIEFNKLFNS